MLYVFLCYPEAKIFQLYTLHTYTSSKLVDIDSSFCLARIYVSRVTEPRPARCKFDKDMSKFVNETY